MVKKLSDIFYRIQNSRNHRKHQVVHFDKLKPYNPNMGTARDNQPTRGITPTLIMTPSSTNPGENLQLLDDDDDDDDMDDQSTEISTGSSPVLSDQPIHYPMREF